jgi:hypothetical protein
MYLIRFACWLEHFAQHPILTGGYVYHYPNINYYLHELSRNMPTSSLHYYLLSQGWLISIGVLLSNDKYFTGAKKSSRSGEGLGDLDMGSK